MCLIMPKGLTIHNTTYVMPGNKQINQGGQNIVCQHWLQHQSSFTLLGVLSTDWISSLTELDSLENDTY